MFGNRVRATCTFQTEMRDIPPATEPTVIGHMHQHQDLIGCSETRTVCAQSVLSTCIPCTQLYTAVQFSSCAVNKPLLNAILTLTPSSD